MYTNINLSVVIPCYNEEGNIKYLFDNLLKLKSFRKLENLENGFVNNA